MLEDTAWAYSNEEPSGEFTEPAEGLQYLQIKKAELDDSTSEYKLGLLSLTNSAYLNLRYWLDAVDQETGKPVPDPKNRRVLISLKKALYGPDAVGIPNPINIVGCVVLADVKLVAGKKDPSKKFPRIYDYKAVPEGVANDFGNPQQYSTPDVDGGIEQDAGQEIEE